LFCSFEIIKVCPYFLSQLLHLAGQFGIVFPEHIPDPGKIRLVLYQHFIMGQLFLGQTFDDGMAECGASAIFGEGKPCPFRSFLEQFFLIYGAPELDIGSFHFFFSLRPPGTKQDCFCGNKNTSCAP
tara:strand:+ start:284 stop:664 length:381 start_codon:yes stop_codon:yes gene_type:complete